MFIATEGTIPQREYDVFVIYDQSDRQDVEALVHALEKRAQKVWFDRRSLIPGVPWQEQFQAAISASKSVLVFLGKHGFDPWQHPTYAVVLTYVSDGSAVRVIPALGQGTTPDEIPMFLKRFRYVDLREAFPSMLDDVVANKILPLIGSLDERSSPSIFLSHANEDAPRVKELFFALGEAGFNPWYDKEKLVIGDRWGEEIKAAIKKSDYFAICLSKTAITKSGYIQIEIKTAVAEYQRRPNGMSFLLPLRLEPVMVPKIPLDATTYLDDLQWMDVFENDDDAIKLLTEAIWKQWKKRQSFLSQ
jgi:hypothetical protein